jgi:hypothetical protein
MPLCIVFLGELLLATPHLLLHPDLTSSSSSPELLPAPSSSTPPTARTSLTVEVAPPPVSPPSPDLLYIAGDEFPPKL